MAGSGLDRLERLGARPGEMVDHSIHDTTEGRWVFFDELLQGLEAVAGLQTLDFRADYRGQYCAAANGGAAQDHHRDGDH